MVYFYVFSVADTNGSFSSNKYQEKELRCGKNTSCGNAVEMVCFQVAEVWMYKLPTAGRQTDGLLQL